MAKKKVSKKKSAKALLDEVKDSSGEEGSLSEGKTKLNAALKKKYKLDLIFRMSDEDFHKRDIMKLPTGELGLDIASGGGYPVGRFIKIAGPKFSSGKSKTVAACLAEITNRPKYLMDTLLIDIEGTWTDPWLKKMGANTDRVFKAMPDTAEQGLDIAEGALESNEYGIIVIDSIAAMTPKDEQESSHDEWQRALLARLVNKFCRKMEGRMNRASNQGKDVPTVFLVNQMRANAGGGGYTEHFTPGGTQQDNTASIIMTISRREKLWEGPKDMAEADKDYLGWMSQFYFEKNKVAPPLKRTVVGLLNQEYLGHPAYSFFHGDTIMRFGLRTGDILRSGTWYEIPDHGFKTQGKNAVIQAIMDDDDIRECLVSNIKKRLDYIDIPFYSDILKPITGEDSSVTRLLDTEPEQTTGSS